MPARLAFALLLAPSLAVALPWDGTYRLSSESDCAAGAGLLRIEDNVLHGLESTCRMTEPVDVLDLGATLYVMACEGEGQEWTERAMLMRAAEGDAIFLMWRGYAFRYESCAAPEEAAPEEAAPAD
ncbi:hypothetical protein [Rubellimicrobium roseum]|uniref:DUF3617 family protein n=1 Tax=Rubellimicrobium roseum TaxID=687525 RepID=A0A5C4NAH1_9RHOB|nr:hypothetical protein [Rubellimicrobium roseum]TNC71834.1 hypothetical protein FHG71_10465 [Rubellimicrobium roseum]